MENTTISQESVDRFLALKAIGHAKQKGPEREEFKLLKAAVAKAKPELLNAKAEAAEPTPEPAAEPETPAESEVGLDDPLTVDQRNRLSELNKNMASLSALEMGQRENLLNIVRNAKNKKTEKPTEEIELGDPIAELAAIVATLCKAVAPIIFKYESASGLSSGQLKEMHAKAQLLNQKLNG